MRRTMLATALLMSAGMLGCDAMSLPPPTPPTTPAPPTVVQPQAAQPQTSETESPATETPNTERVVADTGVGAKGRGYGGGIITEPVRQYFRAPQMVVFDIQIPHAMNLFKASNDNKGPATHDEFMKRIIEENQIKLPKLPEGEKYVYDPATEQLMVERPAKQP